MFKKHCWRPVEVQSRRQLLTIGKAGLISIVYFCHPPSPPETKKFSGEANFVGGFGGSTKYSPKKLAFCGNIYHFRVFYLESASPELKESSIIMKIGFKFAKIEYF